MRNTFLQTVATWPAIGGRFMPFSTLRLFVVTAGMATLVFAIAAPASAQEHYGQKHHAYTHYAHAHYRHYARHDEGRQIVVHAQEPVPARGGPWGQRAASWPEPARRYSPSFSAPAASWAGSSGEFLAAYRRSSAAPAKFSLQRPATAARSLRRSMRPAQSPPRPSRWSAALLEGRVIRLYLCTVGGRARVHLLGPVFS